MVRQNILWALHALPVHCSGSPSSLLHWLENFQSGRTLFKSPLDPPLDIGCLQTTIQTIMKTPLCRWTLTRSFRSWVAQFFPVFPSNSTVLCLLGLVDILALGFPVWGLCSPFSRWRVNTEDPKALQPLTDSRERGARAASPAGVSGLSELQRMSQKSWVPVLPLPMILCIIIFPLSFLSWKTGVIIFPYLQKLLGGLLHCCEFHRWKVLQKNKLQLLFQTSALILSSLTYWITLTQSRRSCHYTEEDHWKRWLSVVIRAFIPFCSTPFCLTLEWSESYNLPLQWGTVVLMVE